VARSAELTPHSLDAESALLGAMLLSPDALLTGMELCNAEDFYHPKHQRIFSEMVRLDKIGAPVDPSTVVGDGFDGADLIQLTTNCPSVRNASRYAEMVAGHALSRRIIALGEQAQAWGRSESPETALEALESAVMEVGVGKDRGSVSNASEAITAFMSTLHEDDRNGIPTGWAPLDRILHGLKPATLTILGARPSMGKSAFAVQLAHHVSGGLPVLLFSLEMSQAELAQRLVALYGTIPSHRIRSASLTFEDHQEWQRIVKDMENHTLLIDDNPRMTVHDIRSRARRVKQQQGLGMVIIDYLQLLTSKKGESRQVEVAEMSRALKIMARELDVPVVALSQLSRSLESRTDKRPMLSDLRESGALEQDADQVLFLFRAGVYDRSVPESQTEVIVAKHRSGPVGFAALTFDAEACKFN
jgi:replicative DNA helicase